MTQVSGDECDGFEIENKRQSDIMDAVYKPSTYFARVTRSHAFGDPSERRPIGFPSRKQAGFG
jgi:hypothetical protein